MRSYEEIPKMELPSTLTVTDCTVRDGAQMPGVVMGFEHKVKIYEFLHEMGVDKIECFLHNERDRKAVKEMLQRGYDKPEVTAWSRAKKEDIDLVLKFDGIEETGMLMSVSDAHLFDKIRFSSKEEAMNKYLEAFEYAVDHGLRVRVHLEDITRADLENFVIPLVKETLKRSKKTIYRICDTLGFGLPYPEAPLPFGIPKMISLFRDIGAKNIEMHMHDDFGLGVANSIAGYLYGATSVSGTLLGIGERAGNAEIEEILLILITRFKGFEEKYSLRLISEVKKFFEKELGVKIPKNKAVVGDNIFSHESGIHTAGVIRNPFTYEPYPPELVGARRKLFIGPTSGSEVVRYKVEEILKEMSDNGVELKKNHPLVKKVFEEINRMYDEGRKTIIRDEELREIVKKYVEGLA